MRKQRAHRINVVIGSCWDNPKPGPAINNETYIKCIFVVATDVFKWAVDRFRKQGS